MGDAGSSQRICRGTVKRTGRLCVRPATYGDYCGYHTGQAPISDESQAAIHPSNPPTVCKAITVATGKPCTHPAKQNGYCGTHRNQAAAISSDEATARLPLARGTPTYGNSGGAGTSTRVASQRSSISFENTAGAGVTDANPPLPTPLSDGFLPPISGVNRSSLNQPNAASRGSTEIVRELWRKKWAKNDDLRRDCKEFLKRSEFRSPYRKTNAAGGELGICDMGLLVLKRRTVAGLGKLSADNLPTHIRSDVELLAFVTPLNKTKLPELKVVARALQLHNANKVGKDALIRAIIKGIGVRGHQLPRVRISEDAEAFRQRLFEEVCLADGAEPSGLANLLTPGRFAATVKEFLEWAECDTVILTRESLPLMKSRQQWLVGVGEVLKKRTGVGEQAEGARTNAGEAVKAVLAQVQWEINGCSDCPSLYDALVDHHIEHVLLFYNAEPRCIDNVTTARPQNYFSGDKGLNLSVLRPPQKEALKKVKDWAAKGQRAFQQAVRVRKLLIQQHQSLVTLRAEFQKAVKQSYRQEIPPDNTAVHAALIRLNKLTRELKSCCTNANKPAILVLPTGVGKTGVITGLPFMVPMSHSRRVLVVAPNTTIRGQIGGAESAGEGLMKDFADATGSFYVEKGFLPRGTTLPRVRTMANGHIPAEMEDSDVIVTNYHRLNSGKLDQIPRDMFDLIILDEGHHQEAQTYKLIREHFAASFVVALTATPWRGDRQELVGETIYTYPIAKAIENAYIKDIAYCPVPVKRYDKVSSVDGRCLSTVAGWKAIREDGELQAVQIQALKDLEVRSSTIKTAIARIRWLRALSGNLHPPRHQAIVQALDVDDAVSICKEWMAHPDNQGSDKLSIDFVASREPSARNYEWHKPDNGAKDALRSGKLDVIVHVDMLGEGFDHPNLSVAVIFCSFRSMPRFSQFVGRAVRRLPNKGGKLKPQEQVAYIIAHPAVGCQRAWELYCCERQEENGELKGKGHVENIKLANQVLETGLEGGSRTFFFRGGMESAGTAASLAPRQPRQSQSPATTTSRVGSTANDTHLLNTVFTSRSAASGHAAAATTTLSRQESRPSNRRMDHFVSAGLGPVIARGSRRQL